jgi:hypothetical protein
MAEPDFDALCNDLERAARAYGEARLKMFGEWPPAGIAISSKVVSVRLLDLRMAAEDFARAKYQEANVPQLDAAKDMKARRRREE